MKVVEKDKVIGGMLNDELNRCQAMLDGLEKSISKLPKGSISKRQKHYKDKDYFYYYLKYRDGKKVVNEHISGGEIKELVKKLELRKKYEKEMESYKKRIAYLNRILRDGPKRINANLA